MSTWFIFLPLSNLSMAGPNHICFFHGVLTHTHFLTRPLFRMSFLLYRAVRLLVNRYHAECLTLPTVNVKSSCKIDAGEKIFVLHINLPKLSTNTSRYITISIIRFALERRI
jgi:hypothetical protein